MERKGFILQPQFVFIDGRTGAILYSENFHEEILYNAQQNMPALSTYFELMDRLMPCFLSTLSAQKIRGTPGPAQVGCHLTGSHRPGLAQNGWPLRVSCASGGRVLPYSFAPASKER